MLSQVRAKISAFQSILYLLQTYPHDPLNQELMRAVETGDADAVKRIVRQGHSLDAVRAEAQSLGVYPVYGKTKTQLLWDIQDARRIRDQAATRAGEAGRDRQSNQDDQS